MWDFLSHLTTPDGIMQYGGLWLLLLVIFAETGLLIGFLLPGDNLILAAGMVCKSDPDLLNVGFIPLVILMMSAAILGNIFGYWFGKKAGDRIYERKDTWLFKKKHLETTNKYYQKYGGNTTLILARFLPYIRTFAPIIAGVVKVNFSRFMLVNISGAALWILSLTSIGYFLVTYFPGITNYMGYIFVALIILTAIPVLRIAFRKKENTTD